MIHAFGDFELDDAVFELRRGDEPVKLPPKTFDLLLYLVRHRSRVVSKAELLDKVWAGEHVTEAVLPTHVRAARAAMDDSRGREGLIQTVHGRGYRFVAPVEERHEAAGCRSATPDAATSLGHDDVFVGRDEVMAELRVLLDEAFEGRSRVVMLVGEPGIGKTRAAEELAREARSRGALVLEGRCYEGEGVPAFWPWVQALRGFVAGLDPTVLRESLGVGAAEVARLVPEVGERLPDLVSPLPLESDQARFRFFDAVTTGLRNAGRARPLVVFLDDLHWADEPTLLLLHFFAREIREGRVLLLGAYRDVELRRQHPLARVLGELAREAHYRRVPLCGLSESDVGHFLEATTGRPSPTGLVPEVFRMTEGNPFFVHEMVRLLSAEGRFAEPFDSHLDVRLPEGVREVIGRRLDRLSGDCNRMLTLAAVIGRQFDVSLLERIAELPGARVLDLLDEAESARIACPTRGQAGQAVLPRGGRYAFSHALIRETLYEELTAPQRVRLHRRAGETLESLVGQQADTLLTGLAHHFFQAAPGGDVGRAIEYCVRAGEQALELLAYEEGVVYFEHALQALELGVPVDEEKRCLLVLALGRARWQAGRYPEGRRTFAEAAVLARKLERPDLLARAALGLGGWPQFLADEPPGGIADEYRALLEEALERLPDDELALRARVLSGLAAETDMETRDRRSLEAVKLARESGDRDALFDALAARLTALLGPRDTRRRLETATELLELAREMGRKDRVFVAREARLRSFLLLGDMARFDRELEVCAELAEELRLPIYHYSLTRFRVARALGDGRYADVERLGQLAVELGRRSDDPASALQFGMLTAWARHERGESQALEHGLGAMLDRVAHLGTVPHAFAAFLYAELGNRERAQHEFDQVAEGGFEDIPADEAWLMTISLCASTAVALRDEVRARRLLDLLEPYADLLVAHQHMRIYIAPVSQVLAGLCRLLGDRARSRSWYEDALERSQRIGARPAEVAARLGLAELLLDSDESTSVESARARELLEEARRMATELGAGRLLERIQEFERSR
jgi:DNA-binding winged helix-turn-helix (wHTH) protein/tetratricopeptide (TPR) repeat protein